MNDVEAWAQQGASQPLVIGVTKRFVMPIT
jgi:hypothetical protein